MKDSTEIKLLQRNTFLLFIGITIVFSFSLLINISNEKKTSTEYAKIEAISNFNNDLLYRRWATIHGGVYVPVTDYTPPNPALKHIPERDIITESGRELTLVNPAYMTRQVYELEDEQTGIKAHITSLNLIRPENNADEWETNALNEFEKGKLEYYSIETINGAEYLRYMAALKTEKGCLKCHSSQGYKLGDIRGGISVSVPMEKFNNAEGIHVNKLILTHIVVFFVIIFLGFIGYRKNLNAINKGELARNEIINSEAKLKLITENISDVVWIIDFETNEYRYVSPSVEKFNGFTQEEMMALGLIPQITPSSLEYLSSKIPQRIERFKQGIDEEFVDELEQNHKDGSTFWTEVKARYIKNIKTGRVEIVGVSHDISEQKNYQQELLRAKEKAEESEAKFRTVFKDHNSVQLLIEPETGKIIDANQAACDFYGYGFEKLTSLKIQDINQFSVEEIIKVMQKAKTRNLNYFEFKHKLFNGTIKDVEVYSNPISFEGKTVLISLIHDVTARKLAEQELIKANALVQESEEQLKLIANNFVDGMIYQVAMLDENKRKFTYVSNAVTKLYGCTPEQAMENPDLIYGKIHPDDINILIQTEKEALRNMSVFRTESRVINPDGSVRWSYYVSQPRIIDDIVYWDGIEVDITKQKQIEDELTIAKEKAEESERLKSVFLANMSHEIRTPMNGIMGFADLLDDPDTKQEEREKYTSIIKSNGERLLELMNNLIDYSKVEAGQMMISKTKVEIHAIFERLNGMFHSEIIKKKIDLNFHIDSLPQDVFTDLNFLESVLINLIKNAIKFTTKGAIAVNCKKDKGELIFCVQDTGIGVKLENINSIFERFNQEDVSLTKKYDGAGLGLAISKSYIEILGGKIWAESDLGVGSRFFFTIPL